MNIFRVAIFIFLVALWLGFLSLLPVSLIFWRDLPQPPDNVLLVISALFLWTLSTVYWFFVVVGGVVLPILMPIFWFAKVAFSIGDTEEKIEWKRKWDDYHSHLAKEDNHNW